MPESIDLSRNSQLEPGSRAGPWAAALRSARCGPGAGSTGGTFPQDLFHGHHGREPFIKPPKGLPGLVVTRATHVGRRSIASPSPVAFVSLAVTRHFRPCPNPAQSTPNFCTGASGRTPPGCSQSRGVAGEPRRAKSSLRGVLLNKSGCVRRAAFAFRSQSCRPGAVCGSGFVTGHAGRALGRECVFFQGHFPVPVWEFLLICGAVRQFCRGWAGAGVELAPAEEGQSLLGGHEGSSPGHRPGAWCL